MTMNEKYNYGQALNLMKDGYKMTREIWNETDTFPV